MRASLLTLHRLPDAYRTLYTGILVAVAMAQGLGLAGLGIDSGIPAGGAATSNAEIVHEVWRRGSANLLSAIVMVALVIRSSSRARGALAAAVVILALSDTLAPAAASLAGPALEPPVVGLQIGMAAISVGVAFLCLWEMWARRKAGPRFLVSKPSAPSTRSAGPAGAA